MPAYTSSASARVAYSPTADRVAARPVAVEPPHIGLVLVADAVFGPLSGSPSSQCLIRGSISKLSKQVGGRSAADTESVAPSVSAMAPRASLKACSRFSRSRPHPGGPRCRRRPRDRGRAGTISVEVTYSFLAADGMGRVSVGPAACERALAFSSYASSTPTFSLGQHLGLPYAEAFWTRFGRSEGA